jgi:hypothetical protein
MLLQRSPSGGVTDKTERKGCVQCHYLMHAVDPRLIMGKLAKAFVVNEKELALRAKTIDYAFKINY